MKRDELASMLQMLHVSPEQLEISITNDHINKKEQFRELSSYPKLSHAIESLQHKKVNDCSSSEESSSDSEEGQNKDKDKDKDKKHEQKEEMDVCFDFWYLKTGDDGDVIGPYPFEHVSAWYLNGDLDPSIYVAPSCLNRFTGEWIVDVTQLPFKPLIGYKDRLRKKDDQETMETVYEGNDGDNTTTATENAEVRIVFK
jgi:hypothetical protein